MYSSEEKQHILKALDVIQLTKISEITGIHSNLILSWK